MKRWGLYFVSAVCLIAAIGVYFLLNTDIVQERKEYDIEQSQRQTLPLQQEEESCQPESTSIAEEDTQSLFSNCYAYNQLTQVEQETYQEIYNAFISYQKQFDVSTRDVDLLGKVYQCVMNDHPEIFYTSGYNSTQYLVEDEVNRITCEPIYTMDVSEIEEKKKQIQVYVDKCIAGITPDMGEYDIIRYLYEYIVLHTEYDAESANSQNICSVMLEQRSVCQGYAKTMQYLCMEAGIQATFVTGFANGAGHAWNLVIAGGNPYYVDTTWGDASYVVSGDADEMKAPPITYDYLLVTTEMLCKTHQIDNIVKMPECNCMDMNYYVKENLYFMEYDIEKLQIIFEKAETEGEEYVTIKCSDEDVFEQMQERLINEREIFDFLPNKSRSIVFSANETQLTLIFMMV